MSDNALKATGMVAITLIVIALLITGLIRDLSNEDQKRSNQVQLATLITQLDSVNNARIDQLLIDQFYSDSIRAAKKMPMYPIVLR